MIRVQVVLALPDTVQQRALELEEGATVADAIQAAGLADASQYVAVALHGVLAVQTQPLHDGDRVELLRPLLADPKDNRRRRARGG